MATEQTNSKSGWRARLDLLATLMVILASGALLWRTFGAAPAAPPRPEAPVPTAPLAIDGAATKGSGEAQAVMIVYSEFECPFCAAFAADTLPAIEKDYVEPGRLLMVFRHFPLEQMHPNAVTAGKAAECAGLERKFWPMHDRLFQATRPIDVTLLPAMATDVGLDADRFAECMATDLDDRIRAEAAVGKELGVSGTPTFFFGKRTDGGLVKIESRMTGARPLREFQTRINALLGGN